MCGISPLQATGCPKIIVPCLCGYCGGAVDSIISVLNISIGQASTRGLRPCLSQSDIHVVTDLWQKKGKMIESNTGKFYQIISLRSIDHGTQNCQ